MNSGTCQDLQYEILYMHVCKAVQEICVGTYIYGLWKEGGLMCGDKKDLFKFSYTRIILLLSFYNQFSTQSAILQNTPKPKFT